MELTLTQLTNLVIQVDRPDIQTVDALFVKMLGDRTAAKMFTRLLYWFPKAVKFGKWVYKSWRDWDAECGLSPAQIKRVHHEGLLERFGMTRKLMKANGAPTNHYVLDFELLTHKISAFLQMGIEQVRSFLHTDATSEKPAVKKPKPMAELQNNLPQENESEIKALRESEHQKFLQDVADKTGLSVAQIAPLDVNTVRRMMREISRTQWNLLEIQQEVDISDILIQGLTYGMSVDVMLHDIGKRYRQHGKH